LLGRGLERFKQVFVTLVLCEVHQRGAHVKAPHDGGKQVELVPEYFV
jgi:hypothetical protein